MAGYLLYRIWQHLTTPPEIKSDEQSYPNIGQLTKEFDKIQSGYSYAFHWEYLHYDAVRNWIHGFPPHIHRAVLEITGPSPAQISYIFGHDWQSQVVNESTDRRRCHYIPVSKTPEEEAIHCLLMNRCGAIQLRRDAIPRSCETRNREMGKFIFGWPPEGGVWCFTLPDGLFKDRPTLEEQIDYLFNKDEGIERDYEAEHAELVAELKQEIHMDGFCAVLKKHGARYFEVFEDCEEVLRLGLQSVEACQQAMVEANAEAMSE